MGIVAKILICLSLIFFIFPNSIKAHNNARILIREGEFIPSEVIIHQGDTITFKNEDKKDHWPASNLHPTHGIYPEFDPQMAITPGSSWEFKFQKSGKFKFHDHLYPHIAGAITVEGTQTSDNLPKIDLKKKLDLGFFEPYLYRIYYFIFPKKLSQELKLLDSVKLTTDEGRLRFWLIVLGGNQLMDKLIADTEGGSKVDCHQEAHLIGRSNFEIFKSKAFFKVNYGCHSGYLHGAMEAFIKQNGEDRLISKVERLCNGFRTDFSRFECLHGIGHGLTAYQNYDLPKALEMCYELSNSYAQRSCFGGVFMENIMVAEGHGATPGHTTKWISQDPHFPCNSVDQSDPVQHECYQMQTSRMLHIFNYNFQPIAQECQRAPSKTIGTCFRSLGRDIAGQTLRDPDKIIQTCQITPPEYYKECITGGLNVIIDFWGERLSDQPQKLCNRLQNPDDKKYCFNILAKRLIDVFGENSSKIEQACKIADPLYYQVCYAQAPKEKDRGLLGYLFSLIPPKQSQALYQPISASEFLMLDQKKQLDELKKIIDTQGLTSAWEFIKATFKNYHENPGVPHDLAHFLGSQIFDKSGFSGMSICGPDFAYGCFHGFLDKAFLSGLSGLTQAEQSCLSLGPVNSGPVASCVHGIGHGLASYFQVKDLEAALNECNRVTSGSEFCFDGVFMEFERSAPSRFFIKDNPLYPCDQFFGSKLSLACGRNQPTVLLNRLNYKYDDIANLCLDAPDESFKEGCFSALGFIATTRSGGKPESIIEDCKKVTDDVYFERCITAAAGELIFQNIPLWQENALKICQNLSEGANQSCQDYLSKIKAEYGR